MTFDMTKCKIGDKLKTRYGDVVELESANYMPEYPYTCTNGLSFTSEGYHVIGEVRGPDIVGLWEEETTPQTSPTITHNLTIKGYTHVLTTEELCEVFSIIEAAVG